MANFALQNVEGRQRSYANLSDIDHTLIVNQSMTRTKQGDKSYDIVRASTSVKKHYAIKGCSEDKCGQRLPASIRIEGSNPAHMSTEQVSDYVKQVFGPAVHAHLSRLNGGLLKGFVVEITIKTGDTTVTVA